MNVVRDRPGARWLPSRYRFALMRLIAFMRFRPERPGSVAVDHLALAIDRDQSVVEMYGVAIWMFATVVLYLSALLPLPAAWALVISFLCAGMVLQIPIYIIGAILIPLWNLITGAKIENNQKLQSVTLMTLMVMASSYFGSIASPVRYVAWFFFAVLLLNAGAWLILATLRGKVREMERQCAA